MAGPPAERHQAAERPTKRPRSSTDPPLGALAISHQLKAGSAHEQVAAAQALLEDEQQLFPQKRARLLQWVVDALIRSQKVCRASASSPGLPASSAEPVHSTLHWHLLAQLVPGSDMPVHADLACAVMAAADACASDGVLQPGQQQLLQHVSSVLTDLRPVYFRPRVEAVRDVLSSLCALATRVLASPCAAAASVLQLCALAARMLTAALRQSANMKRNFTLVIDILPRLVSLRGAVANDALCPELRGDAPELLVALDALLSAAMFRHEQLSDYHLAFTATRVHAANGKAVSKKGSRGLATYQSQLFKTLQALVLADEQHVQVASCAAVSWIFACFVSAMHGETESDSAPKGLGSKISAKAGFDCFVECHHILEPLTDSPVHALRSAALRSSNKLLATLDSSGIYRRTVDENADVQSRGAVHATLREVWRAVMAGSATYNRGTIEPELWYANGAVAQCTNALINLDHQSIDSELTAVWGMLERMRDGQLLGRENCESLCDPAKRADAEQAILHFDHCCTQLVQQIVSTYERLYQMLPLLESLLLAIQRDLVKSDTIVTFGVCGALQNAAPLLPCSQLPPIFGSLRGHLVQCVKVSRGDEPVEQGGGAVDAIVAVFVIILQYCSVDEASTHAVHSELELLNSEVLGPALHSEKSKAFEVKADGYGQAIAHLRRAAAALEFRLQYQKPLNDVQSIRSMSVLGTWDSALTPEQQRIPDRCDLAATSVALQRIAVLHDSILSSDADSDSCRSEQLRECLAYVWRDIDEMQQHSVEGLMSVTTRAKWQQIAANIFLLSKCSSKHVMQKFFSCVVALVSRQGDTQNADSECMATAQNLVQDCRFCELESFREVGLAVVTARIQQLSNEVGAKPWVATVLSSLARPESATEEDIDELLIRHLDKRATQRTMGADDEVHLGTCMSGIASVLKFVRSLPTGFFEIKQMLQCVRLAYAVESFCDPGSSTQASNIHCRAAFVETRRLLGWSLAIVCTSRSTTEVQTAVPLIDAAFRRFLDWPAVVSEDDSCPHLRQYRDAVVNFMRSIATGVSRPESEPIQQVLPSAFDVKSVQTASSRWSAFYLTAFLNQAIHATEAKLRVATGSSRRVDTSTAAGVARPLLMPTDVTACTTALEHCTKLMPQLDLTASINHRCLCTYLRAMAALLDARRIASSSSSVGKNGGLLGSDLAGSIAMAGKLLASNDVDQDVHQSCLQLIAAAARALQLFEPQLSTRDLGCLLAVVFRVHSKVRQRNQLALDVFEAVVIGAGAEHVELLLLIVQSELTTCSGGDRGDLLRVWTAIEVLRVVEEAIRSHSLRHKRLLQNNATGLTKALLHQIHELQYVRTPGKDEVAPTELPWHTIMSAATRNLARLVHYTATSGIREARQTASLLQIAERTSTALRGCDPPVVLAGATGVLDLLTEVVKMCARDVLQCMPMFISCTRKILTVIWSLSSCLQTSIGAAPGHKQLWETAAAQLSSLYELLPKALNASALRRYVPYLLSNYIDAALRHARTSNRRAHQMNASRDQDHPSSSQSAAATVAVRSSLLRGLYTLLSVCSSHELRQLHTVLDSQGRVILDSLLEGHRNEWAFKGN